MAETPLREPSEAPLTAVAEAGNEALLGAHQKSIGEQWAAIYANPALPLDSNAEIALRNPVVYSHSVDPGQLTEELAKGWQDLQTLCDTVASIADTRPGGTDWAPQTNGLEKIQNLVHGGLINPNFRGSVGDIIRASSTLFAASVPHQPGNARYYQGNVQSAVVWLRPYRQAEQESQAQAA